MDLLNKFINLLLYGGLSREQYEEVREAAVDENYGNLRFFAPIAALVFLVLAAASLFTKSLASENTTIYLGTSVAMAILAVCTRVFVPTHRNLIMPFTRIFMFVLYVFSILVSLKHLEYPALSLVIFLAVTPLLIVDRPINLMIITTVVCNFALILFSHIKSIDVVAQDMWNIVSYGSFTFIANALLMKTKFASLAQAKKIAYLSTTDILTGLRNRNSYEQALSERNDLGAPGTICSYVDANGLHELNNTKGHDAGDEMLRCIAREFVALFDPDLTFRTGGDEFVAFKKDGDVTQVLAELKAMQERLVAQGYHVSYGASAATEEDEGKVQPLVRRAELEMYNEKVAYYQKHDRRRR